MKFMKPLLLLLSLILLISVAVYFLMDGPAYKEGSPAPSDSSQKDERQKESPENPERMSDSGLSGDDLLNSTSSDETPSLLLPSQVVGRVFPKVDLNVLALRLPREKFAVFQRTRLEFPEVDWTEIEPTHQAFLAKRSELPLNLNDEQREAYATWLGEVEPVSRALIKLRAEAQGLSAGGMEGDRGYYIDGFRDGAPIYVVTSNVGAATTTGASYVRWNPGFDPTLGDTINGGEFYVNVNDHGEIYEHTEFQLPNAGGSRIMVKQVPGYADGNRNHMTHVAGTMTAWGYNSSLQGMAPRAWIRALIQQNTGHITSYGMATPGQQMTVTNPRTGNLQLRSVVGNTSLGSTDPYNRYNSSSASYDTVMRDYPYYMHFNSTGNSGSLGYESLTGGWKIAKNMIGIGNATAATRDVNGVYTGGGTISGSSSRGPTYDGRINPDFVAKGSGVLSTVGETGTATYSGTSMSSPNAAGSVALLMDYVRQRLPQQYLRSSTYRALLATTADDRGNPGPDYIYGWGILNVHAAAKIVRQQAENPSRRLIIEDSLAPSQTWTQTYASDGATPIHVTIAWLDPASTNTNENDRASRLVNDLDLRLIGPGGTEHKPYVMPFTTGQGAVPAFDTTLYNANAVLGDNTTDPVEKVYIAAPAAGTYTVQVTHKGILLNNQAQPFSVAVSGTNALDLSIEVARSGSPINVGGADGVSGTSVGAGTQLTYTISNVGGGQLVLTSPVTISGQQNCSVTVNTQPSSPLNGGASTNLITTVTPTSGGTWSFKVSIANNDPQKNPYNWLVTGVAGSSATVSFTAVADTYINAAAPGNNYGDETIFSLWNRTQGQTNSQRFGLLRFDLSSGIPVGTTITSASLDFVQNNNVTGSVEIYEATGTWTESGITGATWNNSNGLIGSTLYGTANALGTAAEAVPRINLNATGLSKVQSWINTSSGNHGFSVKTSNTGNNSNIDLRSRTHATPEHHPKLTVNYGGAAAQAPLMIVSGNNGVVGNGGTNSISGTQEAVGTQLSYSIQNLGNTNLTMTTPITTTVGSNCSISVNTQPSSPVAPSGSTNLLLTVTPSGAGAWSATVSIANNDADKNPYTWTISGSAFGRHTVTYNGNTSNSGTAPVDANSPYFEGSTVTVLGNTGNLTKAGFSFAGWNTAANGSGATYAPGAAFNMPGSNVTLYAIWNAPPIVNAGPDQNIFLTASSWTPLSLNPGLWLDAADDATITLNGPTVSEWADKSTFNRHATASGTAQPTATAAGLNGKRVLTFDGGTDVLNVNLDFLAGFSHSAFIVTKPTIFSNIYGAATGGQTSNSLHVGFASANNYRMNYWGNDFGPTLTPNFVAGSANIMSYIWTTGVGKQILANGKSEGTNTNAGVIGTMLGGGRIGRVTGHAFFGGDIAEIIIIPSAVSAQSRQEIEGYLAHKWGLAVNLPDEHLYKAAPPDGAAATTTLAGSASDPESDALTTLWTLENGPASPGFQNATATNTSVTFMQEGIYNLRLTANDGFGSAFDTVTITVNPPIVARSLTYNGNGNTSGDAPVDPQSPYANGATVTVLGAGTLAKTGYTFTGWNTSANGSGTPYAPDATFTINANTTLHAQWTPNTYTVTFDPNGGATPVPTSKEVTFDATYGTLASVSRIGYSFDGWFTAASGGTQVTEATMVSTTNNHTLFAQWTFIPVSVVTDLNTVNLPEGGTGTFQVKLSNQPSENVTVTVSRTSDDTDITIQAGNSLIFTTSNWDTYQTVTLAAAVDADAENGTATITCESSDPVYDAKEVTAIEIDKDTILTVTNNGNGTTVPSGAGLVEKNVPTAISATTNEGYDFVNWTVTSGSAIIANANSAFTTTTLSAPATVQANFAIKTYTVSYSGNGNSGGSPPSVQIKTYGVDVTLAANSGNLTKTGHTFAGWNTAADGTGTDYAEGVIYTQNAALALFAKWTANTYDVAFDANGGSVADPAGKQVTFGSPYGTLATTSRTGHAFNGWFTAASGGTEVTAATVVAIAGNHTLYAQWTADTYTVTYNGNENTSGTAPANQSKVYDVNLTLATNSGNLVRTGFSFAGWNTAADGSGTPYAVGAIYTENAPLTLYARWVPGADGTWLQTTAGPFNWGDTANWTGGIVASGTDRTASFTPNITINQVVNLDAAFTIGNLTFTDSTTASNDLTISGSNALTFTRTSGTPTINVTNRSLTISSQISGNNGLQKSGAGTLTLSSTTSNFSGGVVLNAGTLATTADTNLGTGGGITVTGTSTWNAGVGSIVSYNRSLTVNEGAVLSLASGNALKTVAGMLSGNGAMVNTSSTTFEFNNTGNTFTGTVNNGYEMRFNSLGDSSNAINLVGSNSLFTWQGGAKIFASRPFTLQAAGTGNINNSGSGPLTIQQNLAISGTAGARTISLGGTNTSINSFSGNIADGAGSVVSLTKAGTGTWSLAGTNTYSGVTTMAQSNPASAGLTFQGIQALSPNTDFTQTHGGGSGGHGTFRILDDSATPASRSGVDLTFNHSNNSQNTMNVFVGNNSIANGGISSSTTTGSTIQLGNMNFNQSAVGQTAGTALTVTGANSYTMQIGNVNVSLQAAYAGAWPVKLLATAPIIVGGNVQQAAGSSGTTTLQLDGAASGSQITGNILNSLDVVAPKALSLTKTNTAGDWTLTGTNTYTGNTIISGGRLEIGGAGTLGAGSYAGTISIASTNSGNLKVNSNANQTLSGQISGLGALAKDNSGVLTLSGPNTYTGTTTVSAGKLFINGNQSSATGNVSVSDSATLGGTGMIGGNTTISAGGMLEFDISTASGSHNPLDLVAGRDFTFSGTSTLTITSSGGALPGTYTLITGGNNITGVAPATVNLPPGWAATVSISGNSLLLNVTSNGRTPGSLAVAGADGLTSSGTAGGELFTPGSVQYTLSNPGENPINWTVGKAAAWVDLSTTSGSLAGGANTTVTVSINSNANSLGVGSYNDSVTFTNTTNGTGNTTRAVSLTVTAPPTYTVSYLGNGNTGGSAPADQIKSENIDLILSGPDTFERTGYSFAGWNTEVNGTGTAYAAGATYTANASVTLYAHWTANTYTVTFNPNGSDAPSPASKQVTFDAAYGSLATVNRSGYTFDGWFTAASGGTEVTESTTVATASDHTLYAQWTANTYTVSFDPNGGDAPSPASKEVTFDVAYGSLATVNRSGYTFDGWFTATSGGTEVTEPTTVATASDHTLYAQWTATYTVTFDPNGGDAPSPASKEVTLDAAYGSLATVNRTGYTFDGWFTAASGGTEVTESTTVATASDHTLYAQWTANAYTVTFNPNGGDTPNLASKEVTFNAAYGNLATVSRADYTFDGWFTAASGGTEVTEITTVTNASDHTLYAQWTANTYTVSFDPNGGGAPSPASKEVTFDVAYGSLATVSRTGYTFDGWFTAASGGTEVTELTTVTTASDHTLYAQWTANTYTVSFDPNGGDTPSPASKEVTFDVAYGSLATVSRTGYTFDGWFTAASGGTEVTEFTTVTTASNHTLHAQWTQSGSLAVTSGNFESSGTFGGTFSPSSKQYTLENTGGESIDWTAAKTASWLDLSATTGTLAAGATTTVTLTINAIADDLTPDTYFDTITFTNTTNNSGDTMRGVNLTIISIYDDWASGYPGFIDKEPDSNPDGDTLTNLQEFAFGTNPMSAISGSITYDPGGNVTNPGLPVAQNLAVGGGVEFRAVFGRRKDYLTAGLIYTVQFSADMEVWVNNTASPTLLTGEESTGDIDAMSVPFPALIPVGGDFKKPTYFRVGVSSN